MLFLLIGIRKWYEVRNEERRNGGKQREGKERLVPQPVADKTADCARQHHTQIHDARSKGIMCHLVLSRRHLLHHEQSQSHKTKTITEVLEHDGTTYQQPAFRLVHGKQGIRYKRQIEDAAQREQRPPQSPVRNVIACQQ